MTSPATSGSKGGGGGAGLFIPIAAPSPHHRHGGRSSLSSYSSGGGGWPLSTSGGGGNSGSRRRGSSSANFGGRGNDGAALLRGVKEVLNRIRWDLAETTGVPFEDVRVYLQADPVTTTTTAAAASVEGGGGGGGGEEVEEPSSRLCRQWVREGRCTEGRQRCKYSHALTLVGLGTRPSTTSSAGSMAPLRVLQGYELEAAMGASSAAGTPSSFLSASPSAAPLHRAVFVEYGGRIVWDKEHPDTVWESFLASLEKPQPPLGGGSMGLPPPHPGSALLRRNSSADSFLLSGRQGSRPGAEGRGNGNELLAALPHDVFLELTSHLCPGDCARCLRACWAWSERFGDSALWARFLRQRFNLTVAYTPDPVVEPLALEAAMAGLGMQEDEEEDEEEDEDRPPRRRRWHRYNVLTDPPEHPRREYGQLAHVVRNAQALSDWNGGSSGSSISGSGSRGTSSARQQQQQQQQPPPPPVAASTPTAASSSLLSSSPASASGGRAATPASLASTNGDDAFSSSSPHLPPATPLSSRRVVTTHLHAVQRFHGHDRGAVIALHVDEAGGRLISGDVAGSVRLWELHSGARLATVDLRTHLTCLAAGEWTIYAGTLKGALATVNREDMADVQAHKLGQSSNISALCLLPTASPSPRRRRHHSTQQHMGRHSASSPLSPLGSSLVSPPPPSQLRTPSPLLPHRSSSGGRKGRGTEEDVVRPRLVVGFGNGSFLLLHGTERLLLLQPGHTPVPPLPLSSSIGGSGGGGGSASYWDGASGSGGGRLSSSAGSSNSRGLLLPTVQHHLYALPVSHPACVFLAPTGPRSFVAAACPDRLFLWSSSSSSSTAGTTPGGSPFSSSSMHEPGLLLQLPALSLTCAVSPAGRDGEGNGVLQRHSVEACCDVAVLAILPEEEAEEEGEAEGSDDEEDDDDSEEDVEELELDDLDVDDEDEDDDPLFPRGGGGGGSRREKKRQGRKTGQSRARKGQKPALVVTACDHDAALRWWELAPGRNAAVCTAITPAPVSSVETGTLSLAQAKGVLLSAHLDGSLVVWHVGQRRPVARFGALPLLESIALTPRALGLLACFERHIVLARDVIAYGSAGGFGWGEEGGDDWEEENSGGGRRNNKRRGRRQSGAST